MKSSHQQSGPIKPHYAKINKAGVSGFTKTFLHAVQVSIIIPSFNQGSFIEAAIRSILDQGIESLQIIVADSGSTDGTLQILERLFIEVGSRLVWFSEADQGVAQAINKAIAMSKGAVIGWLNADDLYTGGVIGCAVRYFENRPDLLMVYGRAKHIDETGHISDEYPTLPPDTAIQTFRDRCFICQPTVFLRRAVFDDIGYLDESLSEAFAFDLWLRLFKQHQNRIGYLDTVFAFSRLHTYTRTMNLRRRYALECTKILGVHLGSASPQWLLSYVDEFFEQYPFIKAPGSAIEDCLSLLEESRVCFSQEDAQKLHDTVRADARFRVALADAYMTVHPDGWAGPSSFLRVRFTDRKWKAVRLFCRHAPPTPRVLSIDILTPWDTHPRINIRSTGPFEIDIPLPEQNIMPAYLSIPFIAETSFVPSEEFDSKDSRELAFMVERLELIA